jgi:hypothetical protein
MTSDPMAIRRLHRIFEQLIAPLPAPERKLIAADYRNLRPASAADLAARAITPEELQRRLVPFRWPPVVGDQKEVA